MYAISTFLRSFAVALLAGAALATAWVNLAPESYFDLIEFRLLDLPLPGWILPTSPSVTPLSLVSGLFMPLFFFFLGKELWEALVLERGARTFGGQPLFAVGTFLGSACGAVAVWLIATALLDPSGEAGLRAGWATPIGSDVVLCYVIGVAVFGRGHPALHLLLLLTLALDIVALFAATASQPFDGEGLIWALLAPAAALWVWVFFGRNYRRPDATEVARQRADRLWPYALAGALSWVGFTLAGFPPELSLLPIIPAIPHANHSFGLFAEVEGMMHDPLNRLVAALTPAIIAILFLFGLTRGAIELSVFGAGSLAVLAAFWVGKPLGFIAGASLAVTFGGGRLPPGLRLSDLVRVALVLSTGFVAPVTVLDLGLAGGVTASEARSGLALSLMVAALGGLTAVAFRRRRRP